MKQAQLAMAIAFALIPVTSIAQEAPAAAMVCPAGAEAAKTAGQVADKYRLQFEANAKKYEAEAKDIEDDAPQPNAAEAVATFEVDVTFKRQDFSLDLPEFVMKEQMLSMDVPQIEMRSQKYSWNNPTLVMRLNCVAGPPEVVCEWKTKEIAFGIKTDVLECRTRAGDKICTEVPVMEMRLQEASWDVPVVVMKRVDWPMNVPQVTMKTQKFAMDLPSITVKSIEVEVQQMEDRSQALSETVKTESEALSKQMNEELTESAVQGIVATFQCQEAHLITQRDIAIQEIDGQIKTLELSKTEAIKNNAQQLATMFDQGLQQLVAARAKMSSQIEEARNTLASVRDQALSKAAKKATPEVAVPVVNL